jgi:MFS superfamily sulfate permease-like transporter
VLSLVTVPALTPLFPDPPEAVRAAMIIHAVSHLMKVAEMRGFYRLRPREFWLGMLTLLGVVVLDVLPGLVIGVTLSILVPACSSSARTRRSSTPTRSRWATRSRNWCAPRVPACTR